MSFSYFLYISDSKVDMILPQFDSRPIGESQTEIAFDLEVLSVRRARTTTGGGRIARLERVLRHLQDGELLGTIDEGNAFFWATMPMRWDIVHTETGGRIALFGGRPDATTVVLSGSSRHLIGWQPADAGASGSNAPALMEGIEVASPAEDAQLLQAVTHESSPQLDVFSTVRSAVSRMSGPEQRVEFVAKVLARDSDTILATPVYVALLD
ncbi:hypothetical protein LX16_1762 [Stackebrandtia albiflava]|uniref:Uncharacterized protein n=1 Tax=Stackebrandtia albiflava TaxID=406432 RepID=A0A562VDZ5_9ACTN|nr:SAVMC3_10250 family protein [Stackebrandtia albiflava]TWJ16041.1 hypothetical protein LX16_1762 [Stackebrandtia albiflava]